MEYVAPILDWHTPFFFDVHDGQINGLLSGCIIGKLNLGFNVFADSPVEVFNGVGSVDDFSDLQREVKIAGEIVPVGSPGLDRMFVFLSPVSIKLLEGLLSCLAVDGSVDVFKIGAEGLPVFPNNIFA